MFLYKQSSIILVLYSSGIGESSTIFNFFPFLNAYYQHSIVVPSMNATMHVPYIALLNDDDDDVGGGGGGGGDNK